jgi:hypothetical protein
MAWFNSDGAHQPGPAHDFSVFEGAGGWCGPDSAAMQALLRPYRFGFPSKEAAFEWFGVEGLAVLEAKGFHLCIVPAADVLVSDSGRQCVFIPAGDAVPLTPNPIPANLRT